MKIIIGAGLSGCIAAHIFPRAIIFESSGIKENSKHRAVLRFRTDAVSKATGMDFKKVKVYKGIYSEGKFVQPTIRYSNWYSQKILGTISDRSINNLESSYRYVAPDDFHAILTDELSARIEYGTSVTNITKDSAGSLLETSDGKSFIGSDAIISTIPANLMAGLVGQKLPFETKFREIYNCRFKVSGSDVHQTIYYPDPCNPVYRATLTGEDLIIESMSKLDDVFYANEVFESFGLPHNMAEPTEASSQEYGKIQDVDNHIRKQFIYMLTKKYNIFSLGRFGTWRNILLDDIVDDCLIIKKLVNFEEYDLDKALAEQE